MDRRQLESFEAPWEDKLLAVTGLFAGAFGIGVLPPLAGMAIGGQIQGSQWMMQVLPFGLSPAVLAVTFYFLATHCFVESNKRGALLDFVVFSITAAACVWFATRVAMAFGLNVAEAAQVPGFSNELALRVFPLTAAVLVGTLGAIQCRISRRRERAIDEVTGSSVK